MDRMPRPPESRDHNHHHFRLKSLDAKTSTHHNHHQMQNNSSISRLIKSSRMRLFLLSLCCTILQLVAAATDDGGYKPIWPSHLVQREIFVLNLEDGYFGCQVNESTDFLQLFELSKLCDGRAQCFQGSDEVAPELKCTDRNQCHPKMPKCTNGVCLESLCYCNDGYGGRGCDLPDENECKYRPCDVFAHCTNTMGSYYCSCFPGYEGDGFVCKDINECEVPALAGLCATNAECHNLPGHFVCKCLPGYTGNATMSCDDIDECLEPNACGRGAECLNTPGSHLCRCPDGFSGDPQVECWDIDECKSSPCGEHALCTNLPGGYNCTCSQGYTGNGESGCVDIDECSVGGAALCGSSALCVNTPGSFICECPTGFTGNPRSSCEDVDECTSGANVCGPNSLCLNTAGGYECNCRDGFTGNAQDLALGCADINECEAQGVVCGENAHCVNKDGGYECACSVGYTGSPDAGCYDLDECQASPCGANANCINTHGSFVCECPDKFLARGGNAELGCDRAAVDVGCAVDSDCTGNAGCITGQCQCAPGYQAQGAACVDVNECKNKNTCGTGAQCQNRVGSYECVCKRGYEKILDSPTSKCQDIDECAAQPCGENTRCLNADGHFKCVCAEGFVGDPHTGCKSPCHGVVCGSGATCQVNGHEAACVCEPGFTFNPANISAGCVDINECDPSHGPSGLCGQGALCTNLPGSHHCHCPAGFTGEPFRYCEDVNECDRKFGSSGECGDGALCTNTLGSFSCQCPAGMTGNAREKCLDIDECSLAFGPNGKCGYSAICTNTAGSFSCRCPPGSSGDSFVRCYTEKACSIDSECVGNSVCQHGKCHCPAPYFGESCKHPCDQLFCGANAKCEIDFSGNPVCTCAEGYIGKSNSLPGCVDLDECAQNPCGRGAVCRNTPGAYECVCPHNYRGDPYAECTIEGKDDIDCSRDLACPANEECITAVAGAGAKCVCRRGYIRDAVSEFCRDVNECTELTKSACGANAHCSNIDGGFSCQCPPGFTGNAHQVCYPNEVNCQADTECPGNTGCVNGQCGCDAPYVREGDFCILLARNCSNTKLCPENQRCILSGAFGSCICPKGFTIEANGKCRDIDECREMAEFDLCGKNAQCVNVPGAFECSCLPGYSGSPKVGCQRIYDSCRSNADCHANNQCVDQTCQCLPPFIHDGTKCRHPCDWQQCGQNAECHLENSCAVCKCKAGCTGNAQLGCVDINECTSLLPLDPNGPCGSGSVCINTLGSHRCECSPSATGNPYEENGCIGGAPKCTSDSQCPEHAQCDVRSGLCSDVCASSPCGPNSICVAVGHSPQCQCLPGFVGSGTDLQKGCTSPCSTVYCGINALCIVNRANEPACQCQPGFNGNPWAGGSCHPFSECTATSCPPGSECVHGSCVEKCQDRKCGPGATCDLTTGNCKCLQSYIGDPEMLCVPPLASGPSCEPGCGLNAHCAYGAVNKCVCNTGTSGNPYKSCSTQPKCEFGVCGHGALCLEAPSPGAPLECVCPAGTHGNPYIGCEDVNECLHGQPCGSGAHCINVIGSFRCTCPPGMVGNPSYACQPPKQIAQVPESHLAGAGITCSTSFNCPPDTVCFRGICVQNDACSHDSQCDTNNACTLVNKQIGYQCVDPCDHTQCGPNAFCASSDHQPKCLCIDSHSGDPHDLELGCSPASASNRAPEDCRSDAECPADQTCSSHRKCISVCDLIQCGPNAQCLSQNRRPECVCEAAFEGNPFDLARGCAPAACLIDSDCKHDESCALHPSGYRECVSVCSDFKCGINALCRGTAHRAHCECPPSFLGDPTSDGREGCQPIHASCKDDSQCAEFQSCRRTLTGNRNCSDVCTNIRCGINARCQGRDHQAVCECLPGHVGDATRQCITPVQNLCNRDDDCPAEKKCLATGESGVKDCVDICFGHICGDGAYCVAKGHRPHCECLAGHTRIAGDTHGSCAPNVCQTNRECRSDQICTITRKGVLDCVDVCESIRCGQNAQCRAQDHTATCQCNSGFIGNPEDLLRGCAPKDTCTSNTDCAQTEVCHLNEHGVRACVDGCSVNLCGPGAICQTTEHFVTCQCKEGHSGRPNDLVTGCRPIAHECFADGECPSNAICVQGSDDVNVCQDPCKHFLCGENARCSSSNHRAQCTCRPGFVGDPFHMCIDPDECKHDQDCPFDSRCLKDANTRKCANACLYQNCGKHAYCRATSHTAKCYCDTGYQGDAYDTVGVGCGVKVLASVCENDFDCKAGFKCSLTNAGIYDCVDSCTGTVCGSNAQCRGQGHQAVCECIPGYVGEPGNLSRGCSKIQTIKHECNVDDDCHQPEDVCKTGNDGLKKCFNACLFSACEAGADCVARSHTAYCECREGFVRDGTGKCVAQERDECSADAQCPTLSSCKLNPLGIHRCAEVCIDFTCTPNSKCVSMHHKGQCKCEPGFTGDPLSRIGCLPINAHQCSQDQDCPVDKLCLADKQGVRECVDGCLHYECGPGALCVMEGRRAECRCPSTALFIGNPYDFIRGCMRVECITDTDCPLSMACSAQNKCYDPCMNGCAQNALCLAHSHSAHCKCQPGFTGDPYGQGCVAHRACESNPCHELAHCQESPFGNATCNCPPEFIGDAYRKDSSLGCRHPSACPNGNDDCPDYASCEPDASGQFLCKNPCERVECGQNSKCEVRNHEPRCLCKDNFRGEPTGVGCSRIPRICHANPDCGDSQECVDGQCRFLCTIDTECASGERCVDNFCVKGCRVHDSCSPNEACVSKGYCNIGCRMNEECSPGETCIQNRCQNPCEIKGICGSMADCLVVSHNLTCSCPAGFEGNPLMGCRRKFTECLSAKDCRFGDHCFEGRCRPECAHCAEGERCIDGMCFGSCTSDSNCQLGEVCTGNVCVTGCRRDADCGRAQICAGSRCACVPGFDYVPGVGCLDVDECATNPCHPTAVCENTPGSYRCSCREGEIGDGWIGGCQNPGECPRGDVDCPDSGACRTDLLGVSRCVDLCAAQPCGINSQCSVVNHQVLCTCPQQGLFTGDPYNKQVGCQRVECLEDGHCPFDRQCVNFVCENACDNIDCGPHGTCIIRDRLATCRCAPGFENQGRLACVDVDECRTHPCHQSALCENTPGSYACKCPQSLVGNAYSHPGCHAPDDCYNGDQDCPDSSSCIHVAGVPKCRDRCNDPTICGMNATCITVGHRPRCSCPQNYIGDPAVRCEPVECVNSVDCSRNEDVCYGSKCIDVCLTPTACGDNADCVSQKHSYTCKCREGYFGDPIAGCRKKLACDSDEQCPTLEFCFMDHFCRTSCSSTRDCNQNERCENGRCLQICSEDTDCSADYTCLGRTCVQRIENRCNNDNECDPLSACRPDFRGFNDCKDPCEGVICGRNSVCKSRDHQPVCECLTGFFGNPNDERFGCRPIECSAHQDCEAHQVCNNHKCVSACGRADKNLCGVNAYCSAERHSAICRCLEGFEGDAVAGCKKIDHCKKQVCHRSAICINKGPTYECQCPADKNIGSPYGEPGCRGPNECPNGNSDCPPSAVCEPNAVGLLMCQNPCEKPDACGPNSICNVHNRQAVCQCLAGFTGNPREMKRGCARIAPKCSDELDCPAGSVCDSGRCRPPCHAHRDCGVSEKCAAGRCLQACGIDADCQSEEICNTFGVCQVGCRADNDCSYRDACLINSCKNLCDTPTVCGPNAQCQMVAHQPVCSCPPGFTGDAKHAGCVRVLRQCLTPAECGPGSICIDGACKPSCVGDGNCAIGEKCFAAHCSLLCRGDNECQSHEICKESRCQAGCRSNSQCPNQLVCTRNQCIDPCEGSAACGPNALCSVVNHRINCACPSLFVGRPTANVGCMRESISCSSNTDCHSISGLLCTGNRCRASCAENRDCAVDEKCVVGRCHVQCTKDRECPNSEICNQNTCVVGCRSDTDCGLSESCVNNLCVDPCASPTACGTNAQCAVHAHERVCSCRDHTSGNPYIECVRSMERCELTGSYCGAGRRCEGSYCRQECFQDGECFDNEKCLDSVCSTICTTDDICPEGTVCFDGQCIAGCRSDSECLATDACIDRKCHAVCDSPTACGSLATCTAVAHRPQCSCPPGLTGDPRSLCRTMECAIDVDCPGKGRICQNYKCQAGCRGDSECANTDSCISQQCVNPCHFTGVCGENAICSSDNHQPSCACPTGFAGNPSVRCLLTGIEEIVCQHDGDCSIGKQCIHQRCIRRVECQSDQECSVGSICVQGKCFSGCRRNIDCPLDQACLGQQCSSPCDFRGACGVGAQCSAFNHEARCTCPDGSIGNPEVECRALPGCANNDDCPIGAACHGGACKMIAGCVSDNECRPSDICEMGRCTEGCRSSSDCDFKSSCINRLCQNPCSIKNCGSGAECLAINHEPVCRCPEGYTGTALGCQVEQEECYQDQDCGLSKICVANRCLSGCRSDQNCPFDKSCHKRKCVDPCSTSELSCGVHSLCRAVAHHSECSCPPGMVGDPRVHCLVQSKEKLEFECSNDAQCGPGKVCEAHFCVSPNIGVCRGDTGCSPGEICDSGKCISGCRTDVDCTFDRACYNAKCTNPCSVMSACGVNAHCSPVLHRPQCRCAPGFEGNPYDYCRPIVQLSLLQCSRDKDCQLGQICEEHSCISGCRRDENCQSDLACVHRQCVHPCEYPDACGINALCAAVRHRPRCSCPSGYTGDPATLCTLSLVPVCSADIDCGTGQICERSKCIDACRTDDTCSYTMACIAQRCQDPCSVYGACGDNAHCSAENHRAVCTCPDSKGDPFTACDRQELLQLTTGDCQADADCPFGAICTNGQCLEGCRNDDQCIPINACIEGECRNPCDHGQACGLYSECSVNAHKPVCSCHVGFVGDPNIECRPHQDTLECTQDTDCGSRLICESSKCLIGCRDSNGCALEESCIHGLCQNPCSLFGSCGRNAICHTTSNHTANCVCPPGLKGNPNILCTEAPPQCGRDVECSLGQICENQQCVSGCRADNNCQEDRICLHGACQNPCLLPGACGLNAFCQPFAHKARCECFENYRGNPFEGCEVIPDDYCEQDQACPLGNICETNHCVKGCRNDANCRFEETCVGKQCQNACQLFGACGSNAHCKAMNHDRVCACPPDHTGDPRVVCERILPPPECSNDLQCPSEHICQGSRCVYGCRSSGHNCPPDKACINEKCSNPCAQSGACGSGALCSSANHQPMCSCPPGFRGDPNVECKEIPPECRGDEECGLERICLKSKCVVGCRMHQNCPFDRACVNGLCQSPCSIGGMCGVNTICRAEKHEAQCSCLPGYTGDPLKQCSKVNAECEMDKDCGAGFVCADHQCKDINECLQDKMPCGPGASCQNLPGWFKCTCPTPLVGDAYSPFGCRPPTPVCLADTDCQPSQRCNPVTQECYNICSKPGMCGKGAICKANNYRAECSCPAGYRGNPYIECSIRDSCTIDADCPGNLRCIAGDYCGCPKHLRQESMFCIAHMMNCTAGDPCPSNQECVLTHGNHNRGMCMCPRGYALSVDGSCKDIDECAQDSSICGPDATCVNQPGSFTCNCQFGGAPGAVGGCASEYREGCVHGEDCGSDKACIDSKCVSPCAESNACGHNAVCTVRNHQKECNCRPFYFGDPSTICRKSVGCTSDLTCPGNLVCNAHEQECGCPAGYERQLDYCIKISTECSALRSCPDNQECILSKGAGFCVCPRGFRMTLRGECEDINECEEEQTVSCAEHATCHNLIGSHECRCLEDFEGDPYREGCNPLPPPIKGCVQDSDCSLNRKCHGSTGECYDPCHVEGFTQQAVDLGIKSVSGPERHICGQGAVCLTENHTPDCFCPPGHEGDPYKLCFKKIVCGIDYHCPGNLICLDGATCGCPPNFFRENDFCLLKSSNCTTNNPCPSNEECVYTGPVGGFCVCPHGYELHPSGECVDLNECAHVRCGVGAVCQNTPGAYECSCPPGTIGDAYVKGCVEIDGCQSTFDCANDRECDVGSKQCISPCYICGPHAECSAIDHRAICTCPPGRIGDPLDKQVGCYVEPELPIESRTIPPPSEILVSCVADGVQVSVQLDRFEGLIYVKGHSQDPMCRRLVTSGDGDSIDFKVLFGHCGLIHVDGEASFVLVIQKHPKLITYRARAYHIRCVYETGEKTVTLGFNVSMITTSGTIANTGPPPTCIMSICTLDGKEISSAEIGDDLVLKVDVQPDFIYGGFARSCIAKTMEEEGEFQYEVTDENGCATDPSIFGNWDYDPHKKALMARFNAFKFPSSNNLRFQCNIRVCFGSCPPINCDGVDAFGRRRRRRDVSNETLIDEEDFVLTDTFKEGALREEIMVQSNAILTFEKREPSTTSDLQDSSERIRVEDIDHVCLPKLGLIISMILTTLLALVAVAVAISCWLMAYRRRPKGCGPLPHPPDFPNPLYTTPEPEPIPDYYR